ncbi:hypothetical protein [Xanthomonas arboricola]|uniref:hypothetical protein n=1 Tax=Xanthomonas arboricola TaxID=56448 RepID=UPI00128FC7FA|nr:hypothetical protein [Xanthomonas arboricola]NIK42937.1 hypothetical protein [Xanthomonas arboricola]
MCKLSSLFCRYHVAATAVDGLVAFAGRPGACGGGFPRGLQLRVAILPGMTHRTLRRTLIHGYCGEFRVETMESQAPGQTEWSSTAFVYHRDHPSPIATIEGAGQGEYRGDAREQALRVGSCLAEFLDPKEYRL